jgi:hypothetical protein
MFVEQVGGFGFMAAGRSEFPLRHYFAGITEYTFETRLGVADPPLIDYLSDLLTRFIRSDALYCVRDLAGHRLQQLGEMWVEADARVGDARREAHRHIGDFTLFWTGVYPEALRADRGDTLPGRDRFVDYCHRGKRAYYIASTIPSEDEVIQPAVLERLSDQFELCAFGLSEARKEWERRDSAGGSGLVVIN